MSLEVTGRETQEERTRPPHLRVGLTGSMGGGKSTARELFKEAGWWTRDSDGIVRELLTQDEGLKRALVDHFGLEIVQRETPTVINRKALAQIVFQDADELQWLEGLLHPKVREIWTSEMAAVRDRPALLEIPLLFEKNLEKHFDFTVCIETRLSVQLERLAAKGISPEWALPRIRRQLDIHEKVRRADYVLSNNGSITFLRQQTLLLIRNLASTP